MTKQNKIEKCIACARRFGAVRVPDDPDSEVCLECTVASSLQNSGVLEFGYDEWDDEDGKALTFGLEGCGLKEQDATVSVEEKHKVYCMIAETMVSSWLTFVMQLIWFPGSLPRTRRAVSHKTNTRDKRHIVYLNEAEHAELSAFAKSKGTELSTYIRTTAMQVARGIRPLCLVDDEITENQVVSANHKNPILILQKLGDELSALYDFVVRQHQQVQTACSAEVLDVLAHALEMIESITETKEALA